MSDRHALLQARAYLALAYSHVIDLLREALDAEPEGELLQLYTLAGGRIEEATRILSAVSDSLHGPPDPAAIAALVELLRFKP